MNDALISGSVDFVCLGIPGIITIWSKTKGNIDVKAATGLNVSPLMLMVRDPAIKSIKDFKDTHKIAMPAIKVSMQAIMLQMAAAKEFGIQKFDALDHLTVSMAHPDATAAMLGGPSEIVANFSSAPFQYRQMKNPNIRRILTSTELFDGGLSFNVIAATSKFRRDNPKLYGAFLAALKEATDFINADKKRASEIYLKVTNDKTPLADILEVLADPAIQYTTKVSGIEAFVSFMAGSARSRTRRPIGATCSSRRRWRLETKGAPAGASPSLVVHCNPLATVQRESGRGPHGGAAAPCLGHIGW